MKEIIFSISIDSRDNFVANAFCYTLTVRAETLSALRREVYAAVEKQFKTTEVNSIIIRLHFSHDEEMEVAETPETGSPWEKAQLELSNCASLNLGGCAAPILGFRQR